MVFVPAPHRGGPAFTSTAGDYSAEFQPDGIRFFSRQIALELKFEGADPHATISGVGDQGASVNYFTGAQPHQWRRSVPAFEAVYYHGLYHGIDARFSGEQGQLKSEYVVAPGIDPAQIRISYHCARNISIDPQGGLVVESSRGVWRENVPFLFQETVSGRRQIAGGFRLLSRNVVGYWTGSYDPSQPLWIDPVLSYSTLLGGNGTSRATAIATDSSGNAYVAGYTDALDWPTTSGAAGSAGGVDVVVAKISLATGKLVYMTYIGGNNDDRASGIQVDSSGAAYVTGMTSSPNFPVVSAYQSVLKGSRDAFLTKLNAAGTQVVFSTYFGGSSLDAGNALALLGSTVYVAGDTQSSDMPTLSPYQSLNKGRQDAFVARFSTAGAFQSATYFGGSGDEQGRAIAVDSSGIYLAGSTDSTDVPTKTPAQAANRGGQDGFVAKLNTAASGLLFSTYLGGTKGGAGLPESIEAVAADTAGNVYVGGTTPSLDFPSFNGLFSAAGGGTSEGFVAELSSNASTILMSTYVGGMGQDAVSAITVDSSGSIYVAGSSSSPDFPISSALASSYQGGVDAFVMKFSAGGASLPFSTFLGGSAGDGATAIALTAGGELWVAGQSGSNDFTTVNPAQTVTGTSLRFFVSRITFDSRPRPLSASPAAGSGIAQRFTLTYTSPSGLAQLGGVEVLIGDDATGISACDVKHTVGSGQVTLATDKGDTWLAARLGSADVVQNSQCTITGATSSVTTSGTNLTLTLDVTFQISFKGLRQIYMNAWDTTGKASGPVEMGSYSVLGSQPPAVVSVVPASGSGSGATFTATLSDPNGSRDITEVDFVINTAWNGASACFFYYLRSAGVLMLADDTATNWTPVRFGSADTAQNSQCVVSGAGASITESGTRVTLTVPVSFKPTFVGTKNIYIQTGDKDSLSSGIALTGTYTILTNSNRIPAVGTLSMDNSLGTGATFTFTFSDADGSADISGAQVLINSAFDPAKACFLYHQRGTGTLALADDDANTWKTVRLGTTDTAQNGQCSITGTNTSATESGNTLTLTVKISFTPSFSGQQRIFMNVWDRANAVSGPAYKGRYIVDLPPDLGSVTPGSGAGTGGSFTFVYTDPNGGTDLTAAFALFGRTAVAANGCLVYYDGSSNQVYLLDDAATSLTPVSLGSSAVADNSQCALKGSGSSATVSGSSLTLVLNITFKPAFAGKLNIYTAVNDSQGATSGLRAGGTYTVSGSNQTPAPSSVTPASGSGISQTFAFTLSDGDGSTDISGAQVLFNSTLAVGGCLVYFSHADNLLYLASDAWDAWTMVRPGSTDTAQNSQCAVTGSGSTVVEAGNTVTVTLNLAFSGTFKGKKNTYVNVWDRKNASSGFLTVGSWTVPAH
jgi:hypothetical protein